ncbi:FtsK/SpoIIIE domain-containing protein [Clostridium omnivorum]|uniref:FtsK domain-containing protein n=1 Tax=Clostridium omnivorum TaxID=1604902 RepID=A0ABQ5NC77_9CLOT|nr:FtsK/SpoIIIE domain-containing protein [Clostridium sp. E14]GLC32878.1 hypothetical protein bsdE14_42880 [Clostridium sp. E14]
MIVELAAAAAIKLTYDWLKKAPERVIKEKWDESLQNCRIEGIRNISNETFKITSIYTKDYGHICTVNIPDGLQYETLEKAKRVLEDNLNCILEIDKGRFKEYITVKLVNKVLEFEYAPVETRNNELFLGYKFDGSAYKLDLNKEAHILLAGKTGTGKSFLFASILTNLIYNNSKDVDVYLFQVMKGEIDIFKNCPSVRYTSDNLNDIAVMLKKLSDLIHKRSKQFSSVGIKNISQWNKHFPNKKMKRIIIGAEEISFFMSEESQCFEHFTSIVKAGRSAGIHLITLTQRTTIANLPSELKAQMTVITAKQRSELDSRNAIDIADAAYLEAQEFIASSNDGYIKFKAPTIDEDFKLLNKYVPEIIIPNYKKSDIKDKPVMHGGWHIPNAQEWAQIKDTIPEVTYIKEEVLKPIGQLEAPRKNKDRKSGVIKLSEVYKDAEQNR